MNKKTIANALLSKLKSYDLYTFQHSHRVAKYAQKLAQKMKLSQNEIESIYYGALLHDIGKLKMPLSVLQKNKALTTEEYEIAKKHSQDGANICTEYKELKECVPIILYHHAQFNGGGYPDKNLKSNQIPFGARLVSIVDAYDAITYDRVYRKAQSKKKAIEIIKQNIPQQFDPDIARVFLDN